MDTASSASNSNDTLVQDKEDEPASKKKSVQVSEGMVKEFDWLEWDAEKELMRCSYCKAFAMHASSSLVNGCETLTKHLKSKSHVYCRDCYLSRSGRSKAATQQDALPEVLARHETADSGQTSNERLKLLPLF